MKVPVKIVKNKERIFDKNPKETNLGGFNYFLKKAGYLVLIIALISSQVYLLSAFEAHIINVTARICDLSETRTMGFWRNHCSDSCLEHSDIYLGIPILFPPYGGVAVENCEQAIEIFDDAKAKEMINMLKGQLLAMEMNIACFGIEPDDGELFDGQTLAEIVAEADELIWRYYNLDSGDDPSRNELTIVKNLLDDLNKGHEIRYCSITPEWFDVSIVNKPDKPDKGITEETATDDTFLQASLIDGININGVDTTTPNEDGINISSSDTTTPSEDGVVSGG